MIPSSSLVTTTSSSSSVEYIHRLENEIIELKEARARDLEERARTKRRKLSKKRSKRIFLTFWGARVMMTLLPMGVVHLQVKTIFFLMYYLKLIVLYYIWKSIFAFYNLYIRSCDFNSLVWLLLMHVRNVSYNIVESSEMCRKHTSCLDSQIKVTAWLILH